MKDKGSYTQWILAHKFDPERPDSLYVLGYKLEKKDFIFVMSSLTLLKNAKPENQFSEGYVAVDSTYKLLSCKFPVMIFSTRDKNKKHKVIAFAIVSNESRQNFEFIIK